MISPQENIDLYPYTYMKTGGTARYFFTVKSIAELQEAILFAKGNNLSWFVLGGGSNVLISDKGFNGVVIKNEITGVSYAEKNGGVEVIAGAGENWDDLVADTVEKGLYGLENLSLIPGSVGAAPVQNIGAYGAEIKEVITWVEVFDTRLCAVKIFSPVECQFSYRSSVFKKDTNPYIVTRVCMQLNTNGTVRTSYPDVQTFFKERAITDPALPDVRNAVVFIRTEKLPPKGVGTAGSFFQNPIVSIEQKDALVRVYSDMEWFPYSDTHVKLAAGWLIEHLSVGKGYLNVCVGTHKNQALVLVNFGEQNAQEVYDFARRIQSDVKERTYITLLYEVNMIGAFT